MTNSEIADAFDLIGDILDFQGANPFRVRAYRNGARTVRDYRTIFSLAGVDRTSVGTLYCVRYTNISAIIAQTARRATPTTRRRPSRRMPFPPALSEPPVAGLRAAQAGRIDRTRWEKVIATLSRLLTPRMATYTVRVGIA